MAPVLVAREPSIGRGFSLIAFEERFGMTSNIRQMSTRVYSYPLIRSLYSAAPIVVVSPWSLGHPRYTFAR